MALGFIRTGHIKSKMSGTSSAEACANFGKESSDAVKRKKCNACRLV